MLIQGTSMNDTLVGTAGDDTIRGGDGYDHLDGGPGNDALHGEQGDDTLSGGSSGFDTLDGGDSVDTAWFRESQVGVNVRLGDESSPQKTIGVENVIGSEHDDRISGDVAANDLRGMGGRDSIFGSLGDDVLDGGEGIDTLDGSVGDDRIVYDAADARIDGSSGSDTLVLSSAEAIDLGDTSDQVAGGGVATGFEHVDARQATKTVSLAGGADANRLEGGAGDDSLEGMAADDTLRGGHGDDLLAGGGGDDRISGGRGQDTAVFSGPFAEYTLTKVVGGLSVRDIRTGRDGDDLVSGVERLQFADRTVELAEVGRTTAEERARLFAEGADAVAHLDGTTFYRDGTAAREEEEIRFERPPDAYEWAAYPLRSGQFAALSETFDWQQRLRVSVLDRDGQPVGEPALVASAPTGRDIWFQRVVPLEDGEFSTIHAITDKAGFAGSIRYQAYKGEATPGTAKGSLGSFWLYELDTAPSSDGGFLLASAGGPDDISLSVDNIVRFGPDGSLERKYALSEAPPPLNPSDVYVEQRGVNFGGLSDGGAVLIYSETMRDHGTGDVLEGELKAQLYRSDGSRKGEPVAIDLYPTDVAGLADGAFVVSSGSYARLYDHEGRPLGSIFSLGLAASSVAALPDGGFVASGIADGNLYARRFDAEGKALGESFRVNDLPIPERQWSSPERDHQVLVLPDGSVTFAYGGRGTVTRPDGSVAFTSYDAARVYAALDYHVLTPGADAVPGADSDGLIVTDPDDLGAADSIHGGEGEDTLELSASGTLDLTAPAAFDGVEVLLGASGDDVFVASGDRLADVTRIDGRGGFDLIRATGGALDLSGVVLSGIERVEGGNGADAITGSAAADVIFGLQGNDTIRGGAGDDRLDGSRGDDVVEGGEGDDTLLGGEGSDTADYGAANQGVSVRLATGTATGDAGEVGSDTLVSIENVRGGQGGDRIVGDALTNLLAGNGGDDFLEGGKGDDTLLGGAGDDTLQGALDHDWLEGGAGLDHLHGDSGNDTLLGGGNNDRLVGGAGNDRLEGGGGADELRGESGRDVLVGGAAGDRLYGGYGADVLTGGSGADRFFLTAIGETGTTAAMHDLITDFEVGVDVINLSKINAVQGSGGNAAFNFIGTDAFTEAGQLRFFKDVANNRTIVEGNVNGDLAADFQIELLGLHDLTAGDFVL